MKLRTQTLLALSAILMLLLAGCPASAPSDGADAENDKVTIEMWFNPPDGGEGATCEVEVGVDTFNESQDAIFVNAVAQPESWNATRTALAGGGGPDVVTTPGPSFVFELAAAGQLLPMGDFAEQFGWGDHFAPWALSLGEVEGKLYSVPHELETLVLYYNKTVFEENGWTAPTTIDELTAVAEAAQAAGYIPFSHANAEWRPSNEWFVGEFLNHVAGPDKVYQALIGEVAWDDPDFVASVELLNQYQQAGYFMGGLDIYYTATGAERLTAFATGEAVMNIEGTWQADNLISTYFVEENGGNDWDWVPMPSQSGDAIFSIGMGSTRSINASSDHPEAAAEFLNHFFSSAVQAELVTKCGSGPAPVAISEDSLSGIDPRIASYLAAMSEANAAGSYGYTTWTFWPPKSDAYIYEEVEKVWSGDMTSEEYLRGLNDLFQEELAEGDIPPIPER